MSRATPPAEPSEVPRARRTSSSTSRDRLDSLRARMSQVNAKLDRWHPVVVYNIVNTLGWPALRPLQQDAVAPVLDDADALLLAPTAAGKTEAAIFPLLTAMENGRWPAASVIY